MTAAPIPQTDPRAGYRAQKAEIDAAIARVLDSGQYILGREVESFESAFSELALQIQHQLRGLVSITFLL